LERVRTGESDGIVVWHTDRLFRQPRDLETLIELGDSGFMVSSAHGQRNLADPDDRFILRIEVAHAARSSDDTQRRIKRRFATLREQGNARIGGGRRFGFPGGDLTVPKPGRDENGKPGKRPQVSETLIGRERAAIVKAMADVLADLPVSAVAAEWNAAGLLTVNGLTWTPAGVRTTLLRPELAGVVEHEGTVIGRVPGDPVVEPALFERVRTKFAGRRPGRQIGEQTLASGIVRCVCKTTLTARPHVGVYKIDGVRRRQYRCDPRRRGGCGSVAIDQRALDAEMRAFTAVKLADPRHREAVEAAAVELSKRLAEVKRKSGNSRCCRRRSRIGWGGGR